MMKPTLAIAPSFSRVISEVVPPCTKTPGAISSTGNGCCCAGAKVGAPSRASATMSQTRRAIFLPPSHHDSDLDNVMRRRRDWFAPQHARRGLSCCTLQLRSIAFCRLRLLADVGPWKSPWEVGKDWRAKRAAAFKDTCRTISRALDHASCDRRNAGRQRPRAGADRDGGTDLSIELVDPKVLRVCADPRNLPFSNEKGEGFENKLAELFAEKLQKKLDYMYFPQATGFVRMTLAAHRCDVIMGFPQGDDLVQGTNPYYRTAYALVAKPGSGLDEVTTLEDARLKGKHIGIVAGTPPATNMAVNGLMGDAKPYPLMIDTRLDSSAEAMINDLTSGKIDAAILWGPMAGFYAKKANPPLHVTPLVKETTGSRLAYRIGMGVRPADQNWKRLLNRLIQENQPAINKILLEFGVPLLDENDRPIGAEVTKKSP